MIDRRCVIRLALAAALLPGAWLLPLPAAQAQQGFQRFIPFLVDLPGWTGKKPDGLAMEMPGNSMITATREYQRGDARLNAQIVTGPAAMGALATLNTGMRIETGEARLYTETVDGHKLLRTFKIKEKSGSILVALSANALFSLTFERIGEDEAMTLAKTFNWKSIQAALPK
jgi:hypothetical protein